MYYMHVEFSCFILVLYEIFPECVVFVLYDGCEKNRRKKKVVLYFSARGARSGILCYNFLRVELAL